MLMRHTKRLVYAPIRPRSGLGGRRHVCTNKTRRNAKAGTGNEVNEKTGIDADTSNRRETAPSFGA